MGNWVRGVAGLLLLLAASLAGAQTARAVPQGTDAEFYFTRGVYGGSLGDGWARWAIDYPKADQQFLVALRRLSLVDAHPGEHAVALDSPDLRDHPFVYVLEVGGLTLDDRQAKLLRDYLLSGGFMVIDDFWGSWAWRNFERQMQRVFPERRLLDVPLEHPVFHAFYDIDEIIQVPNVRQGSGGPTHEGDGVVPRVRGIFDDDGRLMVLANWNTDLGDAWEWADNPSYLLRYSTFAYKMGVNFVIYGMSY